MSETTRRDFMTLGGMLAAGAFAGKVMAADEQTIPDLKSEFLFSMTAQLQPPEPVGATPLGNRNIFIVKSGRVEGPKVQGEVLPGGGDWFLLRKDNVGELNVRGTLKTDDGALIYVTYTGVTVPATGYFRTTPRFETASEKYAWMNSIVAVGSGWSSGANEVSYHVHQIL